MESEPAAPLVAIPAECRYMIATARFEPGAVSPSGREDSATEDLVKLAVTELFDTANKLQNGEQVTYQPQTD
jgi:hypothetical protein